MIHRSHLLTWHGFHSAISSFGLACAVFAALGLVSQRTVAEDPSRPRNPLAEADGYRGIWYANQPSKDEYKFKYSGGMATYPQQHIPIAYYAAAVQKTFFVYGGTRDDKNQLLHMVSYYDHATGTVPRPRILLDKQTDDAHDNPTLMIDDDGYLWVFSNSHGGGRPSFIHRSLKPYSIEAFEQIPPESFRYQNLGYAANFSYSQPWHLEHTGFCFLQTHYVKGKRFLFSQFSENGRIWSEPRPLSQIEKGQYQISWRDGNRLGTAFNIHPDPAGLNARTNLYYMETCDAGKTWTTVEGKPLDLPLTDKHNPAMVHDYQSEDLLVYVKDMGFDDEKHPVILYLTSRTYESGPQSGPQVWRTARWTGENWEFRDVTQSDNNYDFGSLYLESGLWRIIGATEPGPQKYNTGGEIAMWTSADRGKTWNKVKQLTRDSQYNHTYPRRPVNAQPDFYALWADGNAREPSPSRLYFTDREGSHVWQLPSHIDGDAAKPEIIP
jgi:hypothetical protein